MSALSTGSIGSRTPGTRGRPLLGFYPSDSTGRMDSRHAPTLTRRAADFAGHGRCLGQRNRGRYQDLFEIGDGRRKRDRPLDRGERMPSGVEASQRPSASLILPRPFFVRSIDGNPQPNCKLVGPALGIYLWQGVPIQALSRNRRPAPAGAKRDSP